MSIPKAASVASRYLQIPLKVQPDYGDTDETSAAVPRGKEAGTMLVRQMTRVKVRTFGAKDIGEGKTEVSGVMNIDFGDAEILPLRFKAEVSGSTVNSFKPIQPISGAGADKILAFYQNAFQQALQASPGKLASKTADSDWAKLFPRNSYLNKFFAEKRIPSKVFDITDSHGVVHSIPNDVVVEAIAQTGTSERKKIEDTIRKIDFANGDVNHFLAHLAKALAEQYSGALRFARGKLRSPASSKDDIPLTDDQEEAAWNAGYEAASFHNTKGRPLRSEDDAFLWVVHHDRRVPHVKEGDPSFWEWVQAVGDGAAAYSKNEGLRFIHGSRRMAFNKYNPDDLLMALVDILEKYELDDVAKEVKKLTPAVQKAWRTREV